MRVATVQFDSKHADVEANISTVHRLVADLVSQAKNSTEPALDLLVLPELALTGYVFRDHQAIEPLLEDAASSSSAPSLDLASDLARKLSCNVVIGFPERVSISSNTDTAEAAARLAHSSAARSNLTLQDARPKAQRDEGPPPRPHPAFNSAALFGPNGQLVHVFRKHFLFDDDKRWASEGPGFEAIQIPGLGTVCVAICMDLNPYEFKTDFEACELANFCVQHDVDLLVVPMAWLRPADESATAQTDSVKTEQPSLSTINYWALRCLPFFESSEDPTTLHQKTRYLIAANRTGTEGPSTFAGSSCVLKMQVGQRPLLLESLGSNCEDVLIADLDTDDSSSAKAS